MRILDVLMPLQDPPCIFPLVGCTSTDTSASTGGNSSDDYSYFTDRTASSSNSRSSLNYSSSSSSSRSSFALTSNFSSSMSSSSSSSSAGTFTNRFSSDAQRVATYLITATNRGNAVAESFWFIHGPTPSGAVFDPVRSSSECVQNGASIQCTSDLNPGETKTFTIAYTVNNAVSCSLSRGLQSVTPVTGFSSVSTSVGCVMTNENASQVSSLSSVSSSISSSSSSLPLYSAAGTGTYVAQQYASGGLVAGQVVVDTSKDDGKGKGKGYKPYPKPRAGAVSDYFLGATEASLLTPVKSQNTQQGLAMPFMSLGVGVLVLMALIGIRFYAKKLR